MLHREQQQEQPLQINSSNNGSTTPLSATKTVSNTRSNTYDTASVAALPTRRNIHRDTLSGGPPITAIQRPLPPLFTDMLRGERSDTCNRDPIGFENYWTAFVSVLARHDQNPLDSRWMDAKEYMYSAWQICVGSASLAVSRQPNAVCQFRSTTTSSDLLTNSSPQSFAPKIVAPHFPSRLPPHPPFAYRGLHHKDSSNVFESITKSLPTARPDPQFLLPILQGKVITLSLHDIPYRGWVTIAIHNVSGVLHGEDVTENFVSNKAVRNDIEGNRCTAQWKIRSECATSRLPYTSTHGTLTDERTVHSVSFSISPSDLSPTEEAAAPPGRVPQKDADTVLVWKKFLLVLDRGASGDRSTEMSVDIQWADLLTPQALASSGAFAFQRQPRQTVVTQSTPSKQAIEYHCTPTLSASQDAPRGSDSECKTLYPPNESENQNRAQGKRKPTDTDLPLVPRKRPKRGPHAVAQKSNRDEDVQIVKEEESDNNEEVQRKHNSGNKNEPTTDGNANAHRRHSVATDRSDEGIGVDDSNCERFPLEPQQSLSSVSDISGGTTLLIGDRLQLLGSILSVPPPPPPLPQPELHLSIRLIDLDQKQLVAWGSVVASNTALAIAIRNPSDDRVRVVCHVCDKEERRLPVEGNMVVDLPSKSSSVMCKFNAKGEDGPIQLHFLAAALPLGVGRPLYHTKLFLNVEKPKVGHTKFINDDGDDM